MQSRSSGEQNSGQFTVFVAIPVFNRIEDTLNCLDCLKIQEFSDLKIIVTDGGSTDSTPQKVREKHPDVIVLEADKPLWWGGATKLAIEWALKHSSSDQDFVLMLNNDTLIESGYISTLIKHSRTHNTAVCGVVVDADDNKHIIDAGVTFDWPRYAFVGRYQRPENEVISLDRSVLPGRGTLIPISAIRKAGNVDDRHFPHYLSDYEFTYRLKRDGGIGMAVAFDAEVRTKVDPVVSDVTNGLETSPIKQIMSQIRKRFSRRSKQNMVDHFWFIRTHAPREFKNKHTLRLLKQNIGQIVKPLGIWAQNSPVLGFPVRVVRTSIYVFNRAWRMLFGPYLINTTDVRKLGLDFQLLSQHQIIVKSDYPGYFAPARRRGYIKENYPEALALYRRVASPGRKFYRFFDSHDYIPSFPRLRLAILRWGRRARTIFGSYLINTTDIRKLDLDFLLLRQHRIIEQSGYPDYFIAGRRRRYVKEHYPEALALYRRAAAPGRKLYRFLDSHRYIPSFPRLRSAILRWGHRARIIFGTYLINATDIRELDLDFQLLRKHRIIEKSGYPGYFIAGRRRGYIKENYPEALALYRRAASPGRKLYRFLDSHGFISS